jgi:hypothetical protein
VRKSTFYSKRNFYKEVNAIAPRAGKNGDIKLVKKAIMCKQGKHRKKEKKYAKVACAKKAESSDSDSSDESINVMEPGQRIPHKKDMHSVLSALTLRVIKSTSKILIQMIITKCLLKSAIKNLKRLLIPWTQNPLRRLMKMRTTKQAKRKKPSSSLLTKRRTVKLTLIDLKPWNKTVVKLNIFMAMLLYVTICDNIKCFASTAEILRPKKRIKVEDLSTVTIGYIKDKHPDRLDENQRFRVLFDSGCGATMINKDFVKHWKKQPVKTIKWSTKAGSFRTKKSCDIEFTLPGFHEHRKIACTAYVDESHHESCNYDMIIGRDIVHSLGINLLFDTAEISWDNAKIHMQHPEQLKDKQLGGCLGTRNTLCI